MKIRFNNDLLLWAVGVIQPTTANNVRNFISEIFPHINNLPNVADISEALELWRENRIVARVHGKSRFYSITYEGQSRLSISLRRYRDQARLFLLKKARSARISSSGEQNQKLAGGSPVLDGSRDLKEGERPIGSAADPRVPRITGRTYWPLISKQLENFAGSDSSSPDIFLEYYSFPSIKSIHGISKYPAPDGDLSVVDLALAIGISPRLLTSFTHAPQNHYRTFHIGKRTGGTREINSPRIFLKTIQYWLVDYLLYRLEIHPNCHSYQKNKSIQTNALLHVGKKYVANVDIENFFGSISTTMVFGLLRSNGFGEQVAKHISKLVTLNNSIPQGAPTSPIISNSYLFKFDEYISTISAESGFVYTRYADDMTLSGENKEGILRIIETIRHELIPLGLRLKETKTRIASRGGQQKVTGIVVNERVSPPRKLRREVRAMFHQASLKPKEADLRKLTGYISYFNSFEALRGSRELRNYYKIIQLITEKSDSGGFTP
jgi:retron-type reverse transcriptase